MCVGGPKMAYLEIRAIGHNSAGTAEFQNFQKQALTGTTIINRACHTR